MMISWWSKHVGMVLSILVCDIWINVLLYTSALVGPLHTVKCHAAIVTVQSKSIWVGNRRSFFLFYLFFSLMSFSEKCSEITDLCRRYFVLHVTVTSWSASFIHLAAAILTAQWADGVLLTAGRFYQSCKMFVFIFKWNRAMAQAVSWRLRTAEDRVRPQACTREISDELSPEGVVPFCS
jgi:hypothetical protein